MECGLKERTKASSLAHAGTPFLYDALGEVRASLVAQTVKNLPAMQENQVRSLGWKEKGNPLQYSCLGNPTDRGA